jgi:hypothetical protein
VEAGSREPVGRETGGTFSQGAVGWEAGRLRRGSRTGRVDHACEAAVEACDFRFADLTAGTVGECFGLKSSAEISERQQGVNIIRYHFDRFTQPGKPTPIRWFTEHWIGIAKPRRFT